MAKLYTFFFQREEQLVNQVAVSVRCIYCRIMVDLSSLVEQTPLQTLLKRKVRFEAAKKGDDQYERLKKLYPPINSVNPKEVEKGANISSDAKVSKSSSSKSTLKLPKGLKEPEKVLFDKAKFSSTWKHVTSIGPGFINTGSSCYMNSVLQCLVYTPALAEYCLAQQHSAVCRSNGVFCLFCELERNIVNALCSRKSKGVGFGSRKAVLPSFANKIKLIAKHFRGYRQEDAHEFLRYFIDGLQKVCLQGQSPQLDHASRETSAICGVFGGYLRSKIQCRVCKHSSCTYDHMLDISVDINKCNSLDKALKSFVTPEKLFDDNQYHCSRCKKRQDAYKVITVHQPPLNLTIQLKQFSFLNRGAKINKFVLFPETLNLSPYMSSSERDRAPLYELYGVVVHQGLTCHSGHYYSFVKAPNDAWFLMNDDEVKQVNLSTVLKQKAYMLFYKAKVNPSSELNSSAEAVSEKPPVSKALERSVLTAQPVTFMKGKDTETVLVNPSVSKVHKTLVTPSAPASKEAQLINSKIFARHVDQWEDSGASSNNLEEFRQAFVNAAKVPTHKRSRYDQEYDRGKVKMTRQDKEAKKLAAANSLQKRGANPFQSRGKNHSSGGFSRKKKRKFSVGDAPLDR